MAAARFLTACALVSTAGASAAAEPVPVAPFEAGLINLKAGDAATDAACNDVYGKLRTAGIDVLMDDTDERAGGKFATMDLIGLPYQLIIGPKGVKSGEAELKDRRTGDRETLSIEAATAKLIDAVTSQRLLA